MLSNKKVSASHTFWQDHAWYVLGFTEVKKMRFCRYMQGKESLSIEGVFNKINRFIFNKIIR